MHWFEYITFERANTLCAILKSMFQIVAHGDLPGTPRGAPFAQASSAKKLHCRMQHSCILLLCQVKLWMPYRMLCRDVSHR